MQPQLQGPASATPEPRRAFYENPKTHAEAIAEFKKALNSPAEKLNYALALLRGGPTAEAVARLEEVQRLAPNLPHTCFNLGIYYKKASEVQKATGEFERMVSLVPSEPIAHYQLGALYRDAARLADARSQFERAAELDPLLAALHFQLDSLYWQNGNSEAAARQLEIFQSLNGRLRAHPFPKMWIGVRGPRSTILLATASRCHRPPSPDMKTAFWASRWTRARRSGGH